MATMSINDSIGSSDTTGVMLLAVPELGIVRFIGKNIPPVCRIIKTEYEKNGKWSNTTYHCELSQGAFLFKHWQTRHASYQFFPPMCTWEQAIEHLRNSFGYGIEQWQRESISDKLIERLIRAEWPKAAAAIDAAEREFNEGGNVLAELVSAQAELVAAQGELTAVMAEVRQSIEALETVEKAKEIKARAEEVKQKLKGKGKMSLADLQALMS